MFELLLLGRRGKHDLATAGMHLSNEVGCTAERADMIEIGLLEMLAVPLRDPCADRIVDVGQERRHEQVSALADLGANIVNLLRISFLTECERPCDDMPLVAVDERAVDIEQNRVNFHRSPPGQPG
jgi:hypothetical protein